jgi:hypothetical protein
MSEKCEQLCATCPKRNFMSQIVARIALQPSSTETCAGYVHESHGKVITEHREASEPAPNQDAWASVTVSSDMSERWYTRVEWKTVKTCGTEDTKPRGGEVDYNFGQEHIARDGHKAVAFISGDERGVECVMFDHAMQHLDS